MRIQDALREIAGLSEAPEGWLVIFDRPTGGKREKGNVCIVQSDEFPDVRAGERPIGTEAEALALAEAFAAKTVGWTKNVRVVPHPFPIGGYSQESWGRRFNKTWQGDPLPQAFES